LPVRSQTPVYTLPASYELCRQIARRSSSSFYYSFLLLPRAKREAMFALYAFLRRTDDLSDDPQTGDVSRQALIAWRQSFSNALAGTFDDPLLPALADTIQRFGIPPSYLEAAISGVEMDLDHQGYETFSELEDYCHHVASAVGLACIHIWGFTSPAALEPARRCGLAFQLTNILRDLKEDAARGRVYLPREDLRRFDYSAAEIKLGVCDERFRRLMRFEIQRAEQFYADAVHLDRWLHADCRPAFTAMLTTYRELLAEIKRRDGDVWTSRVRLPGWRKARIAARCLLSFAHPAALGSRWGAVSG
jgi:phytoene synthase